MWNLDTDEILIVACCLIVMSYLFSMVSRFIRIPSVLLLLFAGIGFRALADAYGINIVFSDRLTESLGIIGLIMIVLEAGLDLKLGRDKLRLIRNSFFSALFIFVISAAFLTFILNFWLGETIEKCLVYAIPLSIMSSSIVIPSLHPLTNTKREFLVYEASFSDIIGIMAFNYFTADDRLTWSSLGIFGVNIILSLVLAVLLSFLLFLILAKTKLNIKFFLIFSLLVLIYAAGKIFHLPSLIIIIGFGLLINNWDMIKWPRAMQYFPHEQVNALYNLLHSVTAETSFLIRTFFFLLFGFSISLKFVSDQHVVVTGSMIVAALFIVRILYLRFFLRTNVFPESFFIPRGLITIVLFYKIPASLKLNTFNNGILFYVILTTSLIMALGMVFYRKKPEQIIEEAAFAERPDIL